jgi:hypothetical protein
MQTARTMRLLIEVAILVATGLIVWITVRGLLDPTWTGSEVLIALVLVLWIAGWLAGRFCILRRHDFEGRLSPDRFKRS